MPQPATIIDVARRAGLSIKTVSRFLNGEPHVSRKATARVLEAIDALNYHPNAIARSLVTKRTRTIGLIVPDVCDPFWPEVVRGAEIRARDAGYNILLCNTDENPNQELTFLSLLAAKQVDGLVLCSSRVSEDQLQELTRLHPRIVLVNRAIKNDNIPQVTVDFFSAGCQAAKHLIQHGYRRVAVVGRFQGSRTDQDRRRGFHQTLNEAGIQAVKGGSVDEGATGWTRVATAKKVASELLQAPDRPQAIFAHEDLLAFGILYACDDLNIRCPDDVAVVGVDDISMAALVAPPLTTVAIPKWELGAAAIGVLLEILDSGSHHNVVLEPTLTIRRSCGCVEHRTAPTRPDARAS